MEMQQRDMDVYGMNMKHGHAAWTLRMGMPHGHAAWMCSIGMQSGHAA
jgi:hypothetical protein